MPVFHDVLVEHPRHLGIGAPEWLSPAGRHTPTGKGDPPHPPPVDWSRAFCTNIKRLVQNFRDTADTLDAWGDLADKEGLDDLAKKLHAAAREWRDAADEGEDHLRRGDCLPGGEDD